MSKATEFLYSLVLVVAAWLAASQHLIVVAAVFGTLAAVVIIHTFVRLLLEEF